MRGERACHDDSYRCDTFSFAEDEFDVVVAGLAVRGLPPHFQPPSKELAALSRRWRRSAATRCVQAVCSMRLILPVRSRWVSRTPLPGTMNRRWRQDTAETTRLL